MCVANSNTSAGIHRNDGRFSFYRASAYAATLLGPLARSLTTAVRAADVPSARGGIRET